MAFFQAIPGIYRTWVWAWEWWTSPKESKDKGQAVDLERLGSGRGGRRGQLAKLEKDLGDMNGRVIALELEVGTGRAKASGVSFAAGSSTPMKRRKSGPLPGRLVSWTVSWTVSWMAY
ncbi:hypothetical protein PMG11_09545 [Penicillium brasilianum]|uniref:Uncharacterized protein n=1 Tax=Penicillium brasilianum TaxID=104259 RepID=A0A0F7U043_PENBI|nr:hypothetical protein PMG11_09545 [Penicillium brasilianum]